MSKKPYQNIIKRIINFILVLLTSISITITCLVTFNQGKPEIKITSKIEFSEDVFDEEGNIKLDAVPVVNDIDGGQIPENVESQNDETRAEAARGYTVDISTPDTFINATYGECIYLNNPYGSQCYNTTALLMENQVGYYPSTCGTGGAKGIWDCRDYNARGNGDTHYDLIYNPEDLRKGDIWVSHNGEWGHTGMVADSPFYLNGVLYVPLYSTNQGGRNCELGGQASNIINMSTATFSGGLRWTGWDYLFEQPVDPIPVSNCVKWHVEQGDTMSKIMLECENTIEYGEAMNNYAKSWYSLIIKPGQSVYDGWRSENGVGLYYNDDIEHRIK